MRHNMLGVAGSYVQLTKITNPENRYWHAKLKANDKAAATLSKIWQKKIQTNQTQLH